MSFFKNLYNYLSVLNIFYILNKERKRFLWNDSSLSYSMLFYLVFIVLLYACMPQKTSTERLMTPEETDSTFAILNFDYDGFQLSSKIANNAADKITAEFYLKRQMKMIDRSLVRAAHKKYDVLSNKSLSADMIRQLAAELNADYLILGSLISESGVIDDFEDKQMVTIGITLRILNGKTAELEGMLNQTMTGYQKIPEIINLLIDQILLSI